MVRPTVTLLLLLASLVALNGCGWDSSKVDTTGLETVTATEVQAIVENPESAFLLDVRTPGEFAEGHIEGAVNIPSYQLKNRMAELPKNKPILVYCEMGYRAADVARILTESDGFQVKTYVEGMSEWRSK
ncbi:MAG: rhodanese-like domain-containing protein [Candidatus Eisenbacteria bacterium]|uniref:Rhodanese-like domain-containing protein n=1 Tax=Eiseniibacteriota bacterium TaxID=2212470 RepID=A0A7Y2E7L1_UNCEI|nr:rhodanese-like domain-containing protein [Candidatus Eisenbacteria bacterium]